MNGSSVIRRLIAAGIAGALGGALVGNAESLLISMTSGAAEEYWLFLFGTIVYGLLGVAVALGLGVLWMIARRASERELAQVGVAAGIFLPGLLVSRYHVIQRVFHEELVLVSLQGIVTHLLLLGGLALLGWMGAVAVRGFYRGPGLAVCAGLVLALAATGAAVGMLSGKPATTSLARRPAPADAQGKPNIILVVVDTLRADAIEPFGGAAGPTPTLAALAADGTAYLRAYAQSSWTRPSIASILTAQYPSGHGATHKMDILPDTAFTMAESLRLAGYWTAAFVTNINVAPVFNFHQGFDEYRYLEPEFYFGASDSATKLAIYKGLRVARERFAGQRMYYQHFYQDVQVVNGQVENWLAQKPPEPFFLMIHYMDPHDPYFEMPYNGRGVARVMNPNPPAEKAGELRALYHGQVQYLDRELAGLFARLRESGLYDRSVIALTADHGEEFQEHGGWWHGTTLYEEAVHVPLVIKNAGERNAARLRRDAVRTIDIAPTLLTQAGVPIPGSFVGRDIHAGELDEPFYAEEDLEGNRLASIHLGDWKLVTANPDNPRGLAPLELYNLADDPAEKNNLAKNEGERVRTMLAELQRLQKRTTAVAGKQPEAPPRAAPHS